MPDDAAGGRASVAPLDPDAGTEATVRPVVVGVAGGFVVAFSGRYRGSELVVFVLFSVVTHAVYGYVMGFVLARFTGRLRGPELQVRGAAVGPNTARAAGGTRGFRKKEPGPVGTLPR